MKQLSYLYMTIGRTIALTLCTFVGNVMSLLFNTLSRFVIVFFPRRKHLLISWLQSLSTVILEPKKIKSVTASTFFPFYLPWSDGTRCHDLSFLTLSFKPSFPLSYFTLMKRFFSFSSLPAIRVVLTAYLRLLMFLCWYFSWQSWFQLVIHSTQDFERCESDGILQARILEWVAVLFSTGSSLIEPRSPTLQADSLPAKPPRKPLHYVLWI